MTVQCFKHTGASVWQKQAKVSSRVENADAFFTSLAKSNIEFQNVCGQVSLPCYSLLIIPHNTFNDTTHSSNSLRSISWRQRGLSYLVSIPMKRYLSRSAYRFELI